MRRDVPAHRKEHSAGSLYWKWLVMCLLLLFPLVMDCPAFAKGGDIVWQNTDLQTGKQEAKASVVDSLGNVIVTGYRNLTGGTNDDYWTVKFKADGSGVAWRASFDKAGGSDQAAAAAVTIDSNDDVVVTGFVWNGVNQDIHTIKYSGATGEILWQHTFNGEANGHDVGTTVTVDSDNNVYVGGYSQNGSGNDDCIILKYGPAGQTPLWQVTYDGPAHGVDRISSITAGSSGIAATGQSWRSGSSFDVLTLMYDSNGAKLWESRYSGTGYASGNQVKIDGSGNVVVTASAGNNVDLDIYTAKYNGASGALLWERSFNNAFDDEPYGLVLDAAGDVFITGYTWTLTGNNDFYTARYAGDNGNVLWQQVFDSGNGDTDMAIATGIVLDEGGDVFVTGFTVTNGNYDFQTLKYKREDGTQLWQQTFNGSANRNERPVGIGLAPGGLVAVSGWSESGLNDMDFVAIVYDRGALNPPSDLRATTLPDTSIQLNWKDNSNNETGFRIERRAADGSFAQIATVGANVTTYTDPAAGLSPNTYYYYRVKAYNAAGDSYYSNEEHVITMYVHIAPPAWSFIYNSPDNGEDYAVNIAVGPDGNPVATGTSMRVLGGHDYYTIKLDRTTSEKIWDDLYDDVDNQMDVSKCIAVDSNNNTIVSGFSSLYYAPAQGNINSIFTIKYPPEGPPFDWGVQYNGPGAIDDRAQAIATTTDPLDNVVVIGYGKNTAGNEDIYVIKYDAGGTKLWSATPFDGGVAGDDIPSAVAVAPDGSVYVTGYSETGAGTNRYNFFTARYDGATGTILWRDIYHRTPGGDNISNSVAVDAKGDAYIAGYATGPAGDRDIYAIKYSGAATPLDGALAAATGGSVSTLSNSGRSWVADTWKEKYLMMMSGQNAGLTRQILANDATSLTLSNPFEHPVSSGDTYYILNTPLKAWERVIDGQAHGDDEAIGVRVDPIDGAVIVAGTTLTGAEDHDITIARYSPAGSLLWEKTLPRQLNDDYAVAMAVDASGYIYLAGNTSHDTTTVDILSVIYDSAGTFLGATTFNGTANRNDETSSIAVNDQGEAFIAGYSTNADGNSDYLLLKQVNSNILVPAPFRAIPQPDYHTMVLNWRDNSPGKNFLVETTPGPVTDSSIWTTLAASAPSGTTSYQHGGLSANTNYCYRISAFDGTSSSGKIVTCATTTLPAPVPAPVGVVSANANDLNWSNVPNNTGYKLERSTDAATWTQVGGNLSADTTVFHDTGLISGTVYYYRVSTINTGGVSSPSAVQVAPVLNALVIVSANQIDLSWPAVNGNTGYNIEQSSDNANWTTLASPAQGAASYSDTGLVPGTIHYYRLRAVTSAGLSGPSMAKSGTTPLAAPTLQSPAGASTSQVNLTWNAVDGATGGYTIWQRGCNYNNTTNDIYYCQIGYGWTWTSWTQVGTTAQGVTSFAATGLSPGNAYEYYVTAGTTGGVTSSSSNVGLGWTIPAAPVLSVSAPSDVQVNLNWSDIAGDRSYVMERKTGTGGTYAAIGSSLAQNSTNMTDSSVTGQTTFCYRLKAVGWSGSPYSNEQCITTPSAGPAVTALTAGSSVTVTWNAIAGNIGYEIQRSRFTDCNNPSRAGNPYYAYNWSGWTPLASTAQDIATYTDTSAVAGETYKYSVRAILPGNSATGWGSDAGRYATTIPPTPTNLWTTGSSATQIKANWWDVCGENTFDLRYKQRSGTDCSAEDWSSASLRSGITQNSTYVTLIDVTATVPYCFQLKANNNAGSSNWSNAAMYLPPPTLAIDPAGVTQSAIPLSWSIVPGNTGFRVDRSLDNSHFTTLVTRPVNSSSYTDVNLTAGRTYYYRVVTLNGSNQSAPSTVQSATTVSPAAPVLNDPSNVTTSQLVLSWNNVDGNYGYKVERSTDNVTWAQIALPVQGITTYTDVNLSPGTLYYYRVSTKRASSDYSTPSGVKSVMTLLPAPSVALNVVSEGQIDLTWPLIYNASNYKVFRSIGEGGTFSQLADLPVPYATSYCGYPTPTIGCPGPTPDKKTHSDTALTENTQYCYQVVAWNSTVSDSAPSSTVCMKTPAVGGPSLTAATAQNSLKIQLNWTYNPALCTPVPCNTPDGFEVWKQLWNGEWALKARVMTAASYTDSSNIEPLKSYTYKVRAFRGADFSPYSNRASATTAAFVQGDATCVVPQADAPGFSSVPVTSAQEGVPYTYTAVATAQGGGSVNYALAVSPSGMSISTGGVISWNPGHSDSGNQSVSVTATDSLGRVAYQNFTISVIRINNAPAFTSSAATAAAELIPYSYSATASDADGDTLTFSLAGAPAGMTINAASGRITWTPTTAQVGNHTITVIAGDSPLSADLNFTPLTATQTFTIAVAPNHPPTIGSAPVASGTENAPYSYSVSATDPDSDALGYALTTAPGGMTISSAGVIAWAPDYNAAENPPAHVVVKVTDARGLYVTQDYTITVADVRRPPQITSTPGTQSSIGGSYRYQVVAIDPDGEPITGYVLTEAPTGMTISTSGLVTWTPTEVRTGVPVTVQVSDAYLLATQSFTIDIMDAVPPPVPAPNHINADAGCNASTVVTPTCGAVTAISGNPVQYSFMFDSNPQTAWSLSTTSPTSYTVAAGSGHSWRVKSRDSVTLLESDWSAYDSFTVAASCGSSSCPLVYSWDGERYSYETDLQGPAISQIKKGSRYVYLYQPSYIVLENLIADADNQYRVKIWESLQEATFLDEVKLLAVDYPDGYEIASSRAENTYYYNYVEPFKIYTFKDPIPPKTAIDKYGSDILETVLDVDDTPAPMAPDDPDNYYTFDFGTIQHPEYAKLVIDGWQDIKSKLYTSTLSVQPYIEVLDADGLWRKVKMFGMPAGDLKTMVVDLSNLLLTSDHRIRLHLGIKKAQIWVLDRIRLDDSAPVNVTVRGIDPAYADLQPTDRHAIEDMTTQQNRIHVTDEYLPLKPDYYGYGSFTRLGDVNALLAQRDDKYVVMNYADTVELRFPALPAPPAGMTRGFILKADNYYKEFKEYKYVEPLPFHSMSDYPYSAPEEYPTDADHTQYRIDYNTRQFSP